MNEKHASNLAGNANVLLIDDDVELTSIIKQYLIKEGFNVDVVNDGQAGVEVALSGDHSIIVLDVMMPKLGGLEVLQQIRDQSLVPVIMLTAKGDNTDRITGLELGADDYVPKPCTARELVARIRAILRRTQISLTTNVQQDFHASGKLVMWPGQRRVEWAEVPLQLTSTEFNILFVLLSNAGKIVSRDELSQDGLGRPLAQYDRSIDVHLTNIRRKLSELPDGKDCIKTVHRRGYQYIVE